MHKFMAILLFHWNRSDYNNENDDDDNENYDEIRTTTRTKTTTITVMEQNENEFPEINFMWMLAIVCWLRCSKCS